MSTPDHFEEAAAFLEKRDGVVDARDLAKLLEVYRLRGVMEQARAAQETAIGAGNKAEAEWTTAARKLEDGR